MTYRPLDESTVVSYVKQRPPMAKVFSNLDRLSVSEVGDGNLNLVFIVQNEDQDKDYIVSSIQNIAAISTETAASTEEVTAAMEQQSSAVQEVANSADILNELADKLNVEIEKFKV